MEGGKLANHPSNLGWGFEISHLPHLNPNLGFNLTLHNQSDVMVIVNLQWDALPVGQKKKKEK